MPDENLLTIGEAADALGVSVKTLRRRVESKRIESERTPGGHRRFRLAEIRRVLSDRQGSVPSRIRPLKPPNKPMPGFARLLEEQGDELVAATCKRLYAGSQPGWFCSLVARDQVRDWVGATARGAGSGRYEEAIAAWQELTRHAYLGHASVLECHSFLEFFGIAAGRELKALAEREVGDCRRLVASLRQLLLDRADVAGPSRSPEHPTGGEAGALTRPEADLEDMLAEVTSLHDIESGLVFLAELGGSQLRLAAKVDAAGRPGAACEGSMTIGDGPVGQVALEGRARLIDGSRLPGGNGGGRAGRAPMIAAPMLCDGRLIGVLCLTVRRSRLVGEHDLLLLKIVGRGIATALEAPNCAEARAGLEGALSAFRVAWQRASGELEETATAV